MSPPLDAQLTDVRAHALKLEDEVNKVIVGQSKAIRLMNTAIFARGHVLLAVSYTHLDVYKRQH